MFKIVLVAVLLSISAQAKVCFSIQLPESDKYIFSDQIQIPTDDGVTLAANLLTPKGASRNQQWPTLLFVNSWVMEEHEYTRQALQFATEGFQVLSYSARGWGCSTGHVDVAGPDDMRDVHAVLDWLLKNTAADSHNIGIMGISYGGGMTLMALAEESRLKTGVAMSAWGSLTESLYGNQTPRAAWGELLLATGYLGAHMNPQILRLFADMVQHKNIAQIRQWADSRSPIQFVDKINRRGVPVFIANNFGDNLFQANNVVDFFQRLTTPKQLDLNQGAHATGEIMGLFTLNHFTFQRVHAWFQYWLQGVRNDNFEIDRINVGIDKNKIRISYPTDILQHSQFHEYRMIPGRVWGSGRLVSDHEIEVSDGGEVLLTGKDSWATTGVPLLSDVLSGQFNVPIVNYIGLAPSAYGVSFLGEKQLKAITIWGAPHVRLQISSPSQKILLVAYLYDVNAKGLARLITHGTYTRVQSIESEIQFDLVTAHYHLPAGHRLALALDTKDTLYASPFAGPTVVLFPSSSTKVSTLTVPVVAEQGN